MYLEEKHLERAKEIAAANRIKRTCNKCYDRGFIGTTPDNLLVVCTKCVDVEKAMNEWKEYIIENPELKEMFPEYFEEEEKEGENKSETTEKEEA